MGLFSSCTGETLSGIDRIAEYKTLFQNQSLAIVANHTAVDQKGVHLVDLMYRMDSVKIAALFGPEHGFRGRAEAGEKVSDQQNALQDVPIYSLYGATLKPTPEMLEGATMLVFDIQDIGVRYYTYIWTLFFCLQAAAEKGIPVVVLDRPNPLNGIEIEGPVLDPRYKSFVGWCPIPVRYGMTVGELAVLFNESGWLGETTRADLTVINVKGWRRSDWYDQTGLDFIPPSPNMPSLDTALIYLGTCLIEGTNVSEGRGTELPFLQFGAPWINSEQLANALKNEGLPGLRFTPVTFKPISMPGKAAHPKFENQTCSGIQIEITDRDVLESFWTGVVIINTIYKLYPDEFQWRVDHFDRLCGTDRIRSAIERGEDLNALRRQWSVKLDEFQAVREKVLLYEE